VTGEPDYSQVFIAKAHLVIDRSMRRQRAPQNRADLLDNAAIIRRRLRTGDDRILKSLGFSVTGISHYLEQEFALEPHEAKLMALAMVELVESYRG
jgi:hypothetical protein